MVSACDQRNRYIETNNSWKSERNTNISEDGLLNKNSIIDLRRQIKSAGGLKIKNHYLIEY